MALASGIALGAPGIYRQPRGSEPRLGGVRMDVCAFVGVAPRGPARVPEEPDAWCGDRALVGPEVERRQSVAVPVESWDEYKRLYGAFEGPGRLPYAVASFFEQGGQRAYIVRIVHDYCSDSSETETCGDEGRKRNQAGVAKGALAGVEIVGGDAEDKHPKLIARNEGEWGNALKAALGFSVTSVELVPDHSTNRKICVDVDEPVSAGSLLRLQLGDMGLARSELRFVSSVSRLGDASSGDVLLSLELDSKLAYPPERAELIEGDLLVVDGAGTSERFEGLGLSSRHPRWMATVLYNESELVYPDHTWADGELMPQHVDEPAIGMDSEQLRKSSFADGKDRYSEIKHDDFFDRGWTLGDPRPGDGIHALTHLSDLANVVVPDLYVAEHLPKPEAVHDLPSLAGPHFAPCVEPQKSEGSTVAKEHRLDGLLLDPSVPGELEEITRLQNRLVSLAEVLSRGILSRFVALLDVPPGLTEKQIMALW